MSKQQIMNVEEAFLQIDNQTTGIVIERSKEFVRLMTYYRCAMMEVETKLNVLNQEFSLRHDRNPISSIKSRLKTMPSIIEKMERRQIPMDLDAIETNLTDIAGIRVICAFEQDVYTLAKALLSQDDITLIEQKDYIANPKPNGYRSLHLIVSVPIFLQNEKRVMKVEIQLRTIAMDCWASLDHQLRYKKDHIFTNEMAEELLSCAIMSAQLDRRMDELREKVEYDD
ncbi:MAG: GTP pyrophosphokinase family protein [Erysipelotrichaceae bacterium]|nr:GTP pyrophosphokinase family protein [Erysipelotrichaceae bacterium]